MIIKFIEQSGKEEKVLYELDIYSIPEEKKDETLKQLKELYDTRKAVSYLIEFNESTPPDVKQLHQLDSIEPNQIKQLTITLKPV